MQTFKAQSWLWILACVWLGCGGKSATRPNPVVAASVPVLRFGTPVETVESAPISLTDSDGSGLSLVSIEAHTVLEDPLAYTELHLTFYNPEPRRREGRFAITLPDNAAISRFAMRIGADFQEGEVVERSRAQQLYEDFLHQRQDPALLEKSQGNQFSARVFPIKANANKEIIVAYSEELTSRSEPYRLRFAGLPRVRELKVDVLLGSSSNDGLESSARARGPESRLTLVEHNYAPRADLEVRLPERKAFALRRGNLVVARVAPAPTLPPEPIAGLTVLFDTSGSRALGFAAQVERLQALLTELARREPGLAARVVAFDQASEEIYRGPAQDFSLRDKARLIARDAFGASNLELALLQLAESRQLERRVLLIGDGVITAGSEDSTTLREAVAKLAAHGVERLDALAEGGIVDTESLQALTRAGLKSTGCVIDAGTPVTRIAERLLGATAAHVALAVSGATSTYPGEFGAVQAGDERLVFAELPAGVPFQIDLGNAGFAELPSLEVPRPLIARAFARAKIAALTAQLRARSAADVEARTKLKQEIVDISTTERVVSDYTALLVLETDEDYRRFGIAQSGLTNILSVGPEGLTVVDRAAKSATPAIAKAGEPSMPNEDSLRGEASEGAVQRDRRASQDAPAAAEEREKSAAEEPASAPMAPAPMAPAAVAPNSSRGGVAPTADVRSPIAADKDEAAPSAPARATAASGAANAIGTDGASGSLGGLGLHGTGAGGSGLADTTHATDYATRVNTNVVSANGLPLADVQRALRANLARFRRCVDVNQPPAGNTERLTLHIQVVRTGLVSEVNATRGQLANAQARACVLAAIKSVHFPKPDADTASLEASFEFSVRAVEVARAPQAMSVQAPRARPPASHANVETPSIEDAYSGDFASVMRALQAHDTSAASSIATAAHTRDPGDVLALIALGEALEARYAHAADKSTAEAAELRTRAARVYGSLIDLFPTRPDLRRLAGERLERLADAGLPLAIDTYRKALEQRPDHPSAHRLLAFALVKHAEPERAFQVLQDALARGFRSDRFPAIVRILREDLALVGAAWGRVAPAASATIRAGLEVAGATPDHTASTRFVLNWETDANDVDFHIYDGRGGHAFYMTPRLPSGGSLYADVTTGYGPECFTVPGNARAFPYVLQAHYYARGPMGFGMGKLEVIQHDGKGTLEFAEHPFVIMKDKAFVELARLAGPL